MVEIYIYIKMFDLHVCDIKIGDIYDEMWI